MPCNPSLTIDEWTQDGEAHELQDTQKGISAATAPPPAGLSILKVRS